MPQASQSARWTGWLGPVVILLAAGLAAAPIWWHGPVGADDFEFHFVSWLDAQHSWLNGIPYPHWATSPNFGAGEPRFVFYPPLTWMLGAALGLVLPWKLVPVAMTFLLLAATGLATRILARRLLPEASATLAGCAALFSGYALFTAYDRTAFGELAGGFWIPLLLLFALRDRGPSSGLWRRALDGSAVPLALVVAGCWLSDAPVGVMACYLLAAVALAAALLARSWYPVVRAALAVAIGVALTGFYLVPAAWEQRWVDIHQATGVNGDQGLMIENNWLFPHHTDPTLHQRDLSLHMISPIAVSMIAIALVSLVFLWLRGRLSHGNGGRGLPVADVATWTAATSARPMPRILWILLGLIPAAVLFLLLPVSLPVWNLLPKLRFLQFPWRWLLVVEAPMGIFFAAAVWPAAAESRWQRRAVASACALVFLAGTAFAANNFFRDAHEGDDLGAMLARFSSGVGFMGTDEYEPPGAENTLVAMGLPDGCLTDDFDDEQGVQPTPDDNPVWLPEQKSCFATATASLKQPEHWRMGAFARRAGFLVLRLRSYPAWRITVNGRVLDQGKLQARQDGLLSVPISQGAFEVTVDWTTTPDVLLGRWLSVLALLALLGVAWLECDWPGLREERADSRHPGLKPIVAGPHSGA